MLISENLRKAICEQVGHEKYNANLYIYISSFLKNKGLDNIAKHFESQHDEETGHSLEFISLLTDLNADVVIPEVPEISMPFPTIIDVAKFYLAREILTTTTINAIKKAALEEDNPIVEEKMREMITKQQNEYAEATTFLDRAMLMLEWWQCALWDASIG